MLGHCIYYYYLNYNICPVDTYKNDTFKLAKLVYFTFLLHCYKIVSTGTTNGTDGTIMLSTLGSYLKVLYEIYVYTLHMGTLGIILITKKCNIV